MKIIKDGFPADHAFVAKVCMHRREALLKANIVNDTNNFCIVIQWIKTLPNQLRNHYTSIAMIKKILTVILFLLCKHLFVSSIKKYIFYIIQIGLSLFHVSAYKCYNKRNVTTSDGAPTTTGNIVCAVSTI